MHYSHNIDRIFSIMAFKISLDVTTVWSIKFVVQFTYSSNTKVAFYAIRVMNVYTCNIRFKGSIDCSFTVSETIKIYTNNLQTLTR